MHPKKRTASEAQARSAVQGNRVTGDFARLTSTRYPWLDAALDVAAQARAVAGLSLEVAVATFELPDLAVSSFSR